MPQTFYGLLDLVLGPVGETGAEMEAGTFIVSYGIAKYIKGNNKGAILYAVI